MYKRFTTRPVTDFGVIGVVYGGWSNERAVSVKSGKSMLAACQRLGLEVRGFDLKGPEDVFALANANIDPADAALMMHLGVDGVFVGSGIFKSSTPEKLALAMVAAVTHYQDYDKLVECSRGLGAAMPGIDIRKMPDHEKMSGRTEQV